MNVREQPLLDSPALQRYGLPEYVIGASPAAGAHFVRAMDGNYFGRLLTLHVRLVTAADVADRTVVVEYRTAEATRFMLSGAPVTQPASTTTDWIFSAFQPEGAWTIDDTVLVPLAPLILPPTFDFRVFVDNIAATDALTRVRFMWERFYTLGEAPGILG